MSGPFFIAMNFPEWSDLSKAVGVDISSTNLWAEEMSRLQQYEHYYSGRVFQEYIEKESPTDPDIPLFPAGINIVKSICIALTDAMFGNWPDKPVQFSAQGPEGTTKSDLRAIEIIESIIAESGIQFLWEAELDRNKFGGCALRAIVELDKDRYPHHVRWARVRRESFFPVWDPEDPDKLIEVWTVTGMTPDQIKAKFNKDVQSDTNYIEHWTIDKYETWLGREKLLTGLNPYGVVPFAYIPRLRSSRWWGDSVTEDIIAMQDEMNMRVADIGDTSAANAHPIIYGKNLPRGFDRSNFPRGSDKMWDLGRDTGDRSAEVGILEPKINVVQHTRDHVDFLLRMARDMAQTPAIVYGDDNGGGQRSGDTLEIRMRSLLASVKRSRAYMTSGLKRMIQITAAIYKQKSFGDISSDAVNRLARLIPNYAEVLPRRQPEIVDEVVKLLSTDPPGISIETAIRLLGRNVNEIELIKAMIADEEVWKKPVGQKAIELEEQKAEADAERQKTMLETKQAAQPDKPVEKKE